MTNQKPVTYHAPAGFPQALWRLYSYAIKVKPGTQLIFVSGLSPVSDDGAGLVGFDVYTQTRRVLDKMKQILEEAEAVMDDVILVHPSITNIRNWERWADAWEEYFKQGQFPCCSLEVVDGYIHGPGQLVQMDAVAAIG